jgi:hypothetical protein
MKFLIAVFCSVCLCYFNAYSIGGEPEFLEKGLAGRSDIVFYGGFETQTCTGNWQTAWATSYVQGCNAFKLIQDASSFQNTKSLRFTLLAGQFGSGCKAQFPVSFKTMPGSPAKTYDSLYFRYYVKFESGFDFKKGGKLPGLMSVDGNSISGGAQPNGTNGWTMRYMWSSGGKAVIYAYLPEGFKYAGGAWGKTMALTKDGAGLSFQKGKWHCIEQFIKLNTIGKENGKLHVWFDGNLSMKLDDVTYRTVDNEKGKIGGVFFSVFHGGGDVSYAPSVNSNIMFDGLVAATNPIGIYAPNSPSTDIRVVVNKNKMNQQQQLLTIMQVGNNKYFKLWAGSSMDNVSLSVTDLSGRSLKVNWEIAKENGSTYAILSSMGLARGIYSVMVRNGHDKVNSQKIVIR